MNSPGGNYEADAAAISASAAMHFRVQQEFTRGSYARYLIKKEISGWSGVSDARPAGSIAIAAAQSHSGFEAASDRTRLW